jgi:hypothetical protein
MKLLHQKKLLSLNPNRVPLTIEKLKTISGFENLTDEELSERLFSIKTLCALMYEFLQQLQSQEGKKRGIEITPNFNTKQAA